MPCLGQQVGPCPCAHMVHAAPKSTCGGSARGGEFPAVFLPAWRRGLGNTHNSSTSLVPPLSLSLAGYTAVRPHMIDLIVGLNVPGRAEPQAERDAVVARCEGRRCVDARKGSARTSLPFLENSAKDYDLRCVLHPSTLRSRRWVQNTSQNQT